VCLAVAGVATAPLTPGRLASPALPFLVAALLAIGLIALTRRHHQVAVAGAIVLLAVAGTLLVAGQDVSHAWDGLLIPAVMFTGTTIYRAEHRQIPRRQAVAAVAVVAAALLTNWFAELVSLNALTPKYMARSVITLLVIGGSFAIGMAWRRTPRFLAWLGRVSYSTYLIHVPLIGLLAVPLTVLGRRLRGPVELVAVAGFLGLLFGLSWLAHRYVELPGQRLGRRLTAARAPRQRVTAQRTEAGDRPTRVPRESGTAQETGAGVRPTRVPRQRGTTQETGAGDRPTRVPRQRVAAQQSDAGDRREHRHGREIEPVDRAVRVAE
jgi:peptidoglycan/LPS O-acetylase OafA/YrhL